MLTDPSDRRWQCHDVHMVRDRVQFPKDFYLHYLALRQPHWGTRSNFQKKQFQTNNNRRVPNRQAQSKALRIWRKKQIFKSFDLLPVSLGDKGRSVSRRWSCSMLAGHQLDCLGWDQCNTFLQKHWEQPVHLCNEISDEIFRKLFPWKIQTYDEEKKIRLYSKCGSVL